MVYLVAIFRQIQGLNDLPTAPRTSVPLKAIADNASKPPAAERHPQGMGRIRYQTKVSYPICEPWCWNLSTFARTKSPSFVGKYTIHGAYGLLLFDHWGGSYVVCAMLVIFLVNAIFQRFMSPFCCMNERQSDIP